MGFEPTVPLRVRVLSRDVPSATQPSFQRAGCYMLSFELVNLLFFFKKRVFFDSFLRDVILRAFQIIRVNLDPMIKPTIFSLLLLSFHFLYADQHEEEHAPLYAGTLLAFYPNNAAPGRISVQPYLFQTRQYGMYNSNWKTPQQPHFSQTTLLLALETGITSFLDITLEMAGGYSCYKNRHAWIYSDTNVYLGFQLSQDQKGTWIPDSRFLLGESFPTGKYQHLDFLKAGSDISGTGSYATSLLIVLGKTYYWCRKHPINLNLNLFYIFSSSVPVHSPSIYGGSFNTRGKAYPGDQCIANFAIQYSIDPYWVLGADFHYIHQNKTSFSNKKGTLSDNTSRAPGTPSSEQFSIAPCLEYNWNQNFSFTAGSWFSIAGRNSSHFLSVTGTVFYYF